MDTNKMFAYWFVGMLILVVYMELVVVNIIADSPQ